MGTGRFDFDEDSDSEAQVVSLGKKLLHAVRQSGVKKDVLVKLLRVRSLRFQRCLPQERV